MTADAQRPPELTAPPIPSRRPTAPRRLSALDILRLNPALHRDHDGKPIRMPISPGIARFIAENIHEGDPTIETGAGMSTLCFLAQGAVHTAIAPDRGMEDRLRSFCREHSIRDHRFTYLPHRSQDCVWRVEGEFQCALIDGGHGFPIPFLDFYYLQRHLRVGGFLIIDDLEIWTGETLTKFLSCEPAWKPVMQDGGRAIVFQRIAETRESDWTAQEFVVKNSLHPFYLASLREGSDKPASAPAAPAAPATPPKSAPTPRRESSSAPVAPPVSAPAEEVPPAARPFLRAADEALAKADLRSSRLALEQAHRAAPSHRPILAALAGISYQLRDFTAARIQFQQAIQLDPRDPVLSVQLAVTCLELEDVDGFESAIQRALAIDANCAEALSLLADLNLRAGRHADAANFYRRLLAGAPNSVICLLGLAKCLYHLGDRPTSRTLYQKVRSLDPANAIALEALRILEGGASPHPASNGNGFHSASGVQTPATSSNSPR